MFTKSVSGHHVQIFGMLYSATFHQAHSTIPWQTAQPGLASIGARAQSMYNQCIGTPVASTNPYNNPLPYPTQPRESQFEGTSSNHIFLAMQNLPQGGTFSSQPGYMATNEYCTAQPLHGSGHGSTQPHPSAQCMAMETVQGQTVAGVGAAVGEGRCASERELPTARDTNEGCRAPCRDTTPEAARAAASSLGRPTVHQTGSAHTSPGVDTLREHLDSTTELMPLTHASNSPLLLSTNSSKSSPPYTSSQRKQLRLEEKSYLEEVKKSIAEGRVPQVRLQQNHSGDIVQYKAQFLNALKLAALAIVPNAVIDVKNPSTMQEIMDEVKRQFIIEKPLPEGMVAEFLQCLYKRNRAVYHRHWTLHGDQSKPDDCASAAWLELVDYWKSMEGSNECERNKANASSKKNTEVCDPEPKCC